MKQVLGIYILDYEYANFIPFCQAIHLHRHFLLHPNKYNKNKDFRGGESDV